MSSYLYPNSLREHGCGKAFLLRAEDGKDYVVNCGIRRPLNHATAQWLRVEFPWTAPSRVLSLRRTFGVGDRLGIAGAGHLRCLKGRDAAPVLAQQSVRELTLTGRSFSDVLDAATFAVFREGYLGPWGADGDHLKSFAEIETALSAGFTMLTLDCSAQIGQGEAPTAEQRAAYLGRSFSVEGADYRFDAAALADCTRIYGAALDFIAEVYTRYVRRGSVDFEVSIDETDTPTTPLQHYFVASELLRREVTVQTVAPRFCGEFQKGVDYRGDPAQLRQELGQHAAIARSFGYKLSIHSGSDKLSIYPAIDEATRGVWHVKTAGTNWLEAMKLVAMRDPALYREAHTLALESFHAARQYYHVSCDPTRIPPLDTLTDAQLPALFGADDPRQLIHITYGQLLRSPLRERLFDLWRQEEEGYFELLGDHIGRHLDLLGVERAQT